MGFLFPRAAIVGVGMIGGSLGRALLTRGLVRDVVGIDPQPGIGDAALAAGAVTEAADTLEAGLVDADLVVLACPVMVTLEMLPRIAPLLKAGAVVTDVCSTKEAVMKRAAAVLHKPEMFVGGHPMAGSEKDGVAALDEFLFENAIYVLTPDGQTEALARMEALVCGLGAVPFVLDAAHHDHLVAAVSHLPHIAATSLVQAVAGLRRDKNELLALAAGGFRDTTRVAMGSPQMWKDICLSNRDNIVELLDVLACELGQVRALVAAGDESGLLEHFRVARAFRKEVPSRGRGILPQVFNVYVHVPDRPGVFGEVTGLLGRAGINIAEIELLRVREEEGGPLRVGFTNEENRRVALGVLAKQGFRAEIQEG